MFGTSTPPFHSSPVFPHLLEPSLFPCFPTFPSFLSLLPLPCISPFPSCLLAFFASSNLFCLTCPYLSSHSLLSPSFFSHLVPYLPQLASPDFTPLGLPTHPASLPPVSSPTLFPPLSCTNAFIDAMESDDKQTTHFFIFLKK